MSQFVGITHTPIRMSFQLIVEVDVLESCSSNVRGIFLVYIRGFGNYVIVLSRLIRESARLALPNIQIIFDIFRVLRVYRWNRVSLQIERSCAGRKVYMISLRSSKSRAMIESTWKGNRLASCWTRILASEMAALMAKISAEAIDLTGFLALTDDGDNLSQNIDQSR